VVEKKVASFPSSACIEVKTPIRSFVPFTSGKELRPANGGIAIVRPPSKGNFEIGGIKEDHNEKAKTWKKEFRSLSHRAELHGTDFRLRAGG
jgi:hypothetical protein